MYVIYLEIVIQCEVEISFIPLMFTHLAQCSPDHVSPEFTTVSSLPSPPE